MADKFTPQEQAFLAELGELLRRHNVSIETERSMEYFDYFVSKGDEETIHISVRHLGEKHFPGASEDVGKK